MLRVNNIIHQLSQYGHSFLILQAQNMASLNGLCASLDTLQIQILCIIQYVNNTQQPHAVAIKGTLRLFGVEH